MDSRKSHKRELIVFLSSILSAIALQATDKTVGEATIYSTEFNGRKTSTGETFNNAGLSAASNKLPLGSKVQVKNKKTGQTTTVKITDRTAKNAHCAVDLSKGAADKIGVKGKAPVVATVVSKGDGHTK